MPTNLLPIIKRDFADRGKQLKLTFSYEISDDGKTFTITDEGIDDKKITLQTRSPSSM